VRAVADGGDRVADDDEDAFRCSVTQSAPPSPAKQRRASDGHRGLARIFRGKQASGNTIALTATTGSSFGAGPFDIVPRASSASDLGSAVSVVGLDPGLDPAERRRGLGRLLGRKRVAEEANLPASPAGSAAQAGSSGRVADGDAPPQPQQQQQNRRRLFAGLRKRLHMA